VTRHIRQMFKVKRSKVKVTRSRDVSADKNAVTRQWIVISTSNLVEIFNLGVDTGVVPAIKPEATAIFAPQDGRFKITVSFDGRRFCVPKFRH